MDNIIRNPTQNEQGDFAVLSTKHGRVKTPQDRFKAEISKHELEATKKGLPFASQAAWIETKEFLENEVKSQIKKYGYLKESVKMPKIDWNKYSDLKNFELVDSGETSDRQLSKENPGIPVKLKWNKYQFKGYSYTYKVMESAEDAVARARKATK